MATQTVYFNNPADITALQQSNTWTRGQFVSSDLIYTIPANCFTGTLTSEQGPAQAVSVYKVVYYSSDSTTSSVQRVSASVFVPAAISKTGSIVLNIKGLQPGNNSSAIGWETYSNTSLQAALTAASPSNAAKLNPTTLGITFPALYAIEAGYGYITTDADGFGMGVSQNDCVFTYMSQINPQVDLLRCLRNMYNSSVTAQRALFGNAVYNGSAFPITVSGYSLGGIIAPGLVNEFSAGVSAIIPATEASAFTFKRILCGAVPDGENQVKLISNTNIGNFIINPTLLFLYSNIGGNQPTHSLFAQPEALSTYWSFWTDIDQKANITQDIASISSLLLYSQDVAPPTSTYQYTPIFPSLMGGQFGFTGADMRQLYRPEYTGSVGRIFKNLHGWSNPSRPLYTLPDCGVVHIYSNLDEVVCPYGPTGGIAGLYGGVKSAQAGYNFDCAATLDKYMGVGDVGTYYNFTGAARASSTVTTITINPADIPASITSAVTSTATTTTASNSDAYQRIVMDFLTVRQLAPELLGAADHGGFTLYYQTVINNVLNLFTNAN
jgi:hypothetical protein